MLGKDKMPFTTVLLLMSFFTIQCVKAQHTLVESLKMEVKETKIDNQLLSNVVKIVNYSDDEFSGTLKFDSNSGLRLLSQNNRDVSISPGDSSFFAFKLIVDKSLSAGSKAYKYSLLDRSGKEVLIRDMGYTIDLREHINLIVDEATYIILNPEDSVRINVTVNNMGNRSE